MSLTNKKYVLLKKIQFVSKINYKEHMFLKKFITEQGKIIPSFVTGVSANIKKAYKRN